MKTILLFLVLFSLDVKSAPSVYDDEIDAHVPDYKRVDVFINHFQSKSIFLDNHYIHLLMETMKMDEKNELMTLQIHEILNQLQNIKETLESNPQSEVDTELEVLTNSVLKFIKNSYENKELLDYTIDWVSSRAKYVKNDYKTQTSFNEIESQYFYSQMNIEGNLNRMSDLVKALTDSLDNSIVQGVMNHTEIIQIISQFLKHKIQHNLYIEPIKKAINLIDDLIRNKPLLSIVVE